MSRSKVRLLALGHVDEVKNEAGYNVNVHEAMGKDKTISWPPLERITVKNIDGWCSMLKLLIFLGAVNGFRSEKQKTNRYKKGYKKGFLPAPAEGWGPTTT